MTDPTRSYTRRELLASGGSLFFSSCAVRSADEPEYDLLLKGSHVIDAKNGLSVVRDVAIHDGRVAAVANSIDASKGFKVVDCGGLYITPGLIDLHGVTTVVSRRLHVSRRSDDGCGRWLCGVAEFRPIPRNGY